MVTPPHDALGKSKKEKNKEKMKLVNINTAGLRYLAGTLPAV
jgi:hypothetical protein